MKVLLIVCVTTLGVLAAPAQAQVQNPDNGHWYEAVPSLAPIDWNQARENASLRNYMGMSGHLATISDMAENTFVRGLTPDAIWIGGWQDPGNAEYSEPAGGWVWVTDEPMTFTNWDTSTGQPDNCGEIEHHMTMDSSAGAWNDEGCGDVYAYVIEYEPDTGTSYCPLTPNSTGEGAQISLLGSLSVQMNNLGLQAGPMAVGEPGVFYYGPNQIQAPFGNGNRCVGGSVSTIVRVFPFAVADESGFMNATLDNTLPAHEQIVPGATLNFQAWFRDPLGGGVGFNLSDAVSVQFRL